MVEVTISTTTLCVYYFHGADRKGGRLTNSISVEEFTVIHIVLEKDP